MKLEIFSDVICPWCYVGQARLEQALAARPAAQPQITWMPYQLDPSVPEDGRDRREYLLEKFGDVSHFDNAKRQLEQIGQSVGIDFRFDSIQRTPNTRRAHLLIARARRESPALEAAMSVRLFRAYFTDGLDIGNPEVLCSLAAETGIAAEAARAALADAELAQEVTALQDLVRRWKISGVPTFVFDRRFAFSGAQPLEVFLRALDA
ncbi:MAG: DsbA family oxidoreductase [Sinobacteraceae bacterium]|nr:DsbA family oxidoreductase [Nevskiaceae bacterium]